MYLVAGGYLSFFFMISHNFEGAQALTDTTRPSNKGSEKNSFLYKQVTLIIKASLHFIKHFILIVTLIVKYI